MAWLQERTSKAGLTAHVVLWRGTTAAGTIGQTSLTFTDKATALAFKARLEDHGEDEARRWLARQEPSEPTCPTLDEVAEKFFTWKLPRVRSERTVADYRRDYRNHMQARFGRERASDIDEFMVHEWVDELIEDEYAPKTVASFHAQLSAIYKWGCSPSSGKLLHHNPCGATGNLPKRHKNRAKGLRPGEWALLYEAALQVDPDVADLLLFLVGSGWRWSEAAALQVSQIDDDGETVSVDMDAVFRRDSWGKVRRIADSGKSDAALRTVKLSPAVGEMVRRRMRGKPNSALVFTNPSGGAWHYSNFLNRYWLRPNGAKTGKAPRVLEVAEELGLARRPTIHWLRHTHVYFLIKAGASLPEIQKRLGHESITTTVDIYGSMVDDVSAETLESFDHQLEGRLRRLVAVAPAVER